MASLAASVDEGLNWNLNGQKLGRKGRETRARIIAAATELIREEDGEPLTLSAVARRASLGMTSLYLYFADLTELVIAVLEPVIATAERDYVWRLRTRWPDDELASHCRDFVDDFHTYWLKHSRLLHLRNSMADAHDARMMGERVKVARTLISLLIAQMDSEQTSLEAPQSAMASVLMTAIERAATVWTDAALHNMMVSPTFGHGARFLAPTARLLELGIRDMRALANH